MTTPTTAAGRALLDYVQSMGNGGAAYRGARDVTERILAIEAEARAEADAQRATEDISTAGYIVALTEALEAVLRSENDDGVPLADFFDPEFLAETSAVLADTAPAAAEARAEIEREAVKPFRRLVESIKWVPLENEDDGPAEFAVADPDAYREAFALLRGKAEKEASDE